MSKSIFGGLIAAVAALALVTAGCSKKKKKTGDTKTPPPSAMTAVPDAAATMDPGMGPMDPGTDAMDPMTDPGMEAMLGKDPTAPTKGQAAARMILIAWKNSAGADTEKLTRTKAQAKALATKIAADARAKGSEKNFAALAKKHNTGPMKSTGGKLSPFGPDDVSALVAKTVFALKKGGVSNPVESPAGYHIFMRTQ